MFSVRIARKNTLDEKSVFCGPVTKPTIDKIMSNGD